MHTVCLSYQQTTKVASKVRVNNIRDKKNKNTFLSEIKVYEEHAYFQKMINKKVLGPWIAHLSPGTYDALTLKIFLFFALVAMLFS